MADWIAAHTLEEVLAGFEAVSAPIAPAYDTAQISQDPHYLARESFVDPSRPRPGRDHDARHRAPAEPDPWPDPLQRADGDWGGYGCGAWRAGAGASAAGSAVLALYGQQ